MSTRCADSCFRRWSFLLTVVFLVHQAALGQTKDFLRTITDDLAPLEVEHQNRSY
jgi:hypothetical protein